MDYIGVKRVDAEGEVVGELRLIGLFTSKAYAESARQIPLVRRKLESIMQWEDLIAGSHDYKAVVALFDSFPKDELFAATASELRATIMALLGMQEEGGVRLFLRRDPVRRTVAASSPSRAITCPPSFASGSSTCSSCGSAAAPWTTPSRSPTDPARFHFTIHVPAGDIPDPPLAELQREVADAARSWDDSLSDALVAKLGAGRGHELARRYAARFPDYYKSAAAIYQATFDVEQFERLGADRPYVVGAPERAGHRRAADPPQALQDRGQGAADRPPAAARAARPDRRRGGADPARRHRRGRSLPPRLRRARPGRQAARPRADGGASSPTRWARSGRGEAGSDWLNRLVVTGELDWRRVTILRAYREYRQLLGADLHRRATRTTASFGNSAISRKLVAALRAALRPGRRPRRGRRGRAGRRDRGRPGRRPEPRRRPHPARLPGHDPGDRAHERVPARPRVPVVQAALRRRAGDAQAGAAVGDLRVLDRDGRRAPARRHGGPRRHPLVGPAARTTAPRSWA